MSINKFFLLCIALLFLQCQNQDKSRNPIVLFIAIDDLNDWIGFLGGHPQAKTPNLDHEYITSQPLLWERLVRAYLASSSFADAMVGEVIQALEDSPYANNTIIVVWGDHGWHLGEKESWGEMTLWGRGTKTPLIVRVPDNASTGTSINHPVSLQDIYPTLVELCDLQADQKVDGNSIAPLIDDPNKEWDHPVIMAHGSGNFAIRLGKWRYIQYKNGDEELYNVENDPQEFNNLVNPPKTNVVAGKMKEYIPSEFIKLYGPRFKKFKNLDSINLE